MSWTLSQVVLRLCSPMHIGQNKIGNVQRTRLYVTGRVLWGALTQRLTRDSFQSGGPATQFNQYYEVSQVVHSRLAFTYFYPTIEAKGNVSLWPWEDGFRSRFLSTHASTALTYPQQSAAEGTLHEVECIVPRTLDGGHQVYLTGYILHQQGASNDWREALSRLQLGGERGYGWGRIEPICVQEVQPEKGQNADEARFCLFGCYSAKPGSDWPPVITAGPEARLLAHALAADFDPEHLAVTGVTGEVEPLVGLETDRDGRFGRQVSRAWVCYVPGSTVAAGAHMRVGPYGIWEAAM